MKAMILAAGLGTRLRPLTDNKPKAMIRVQDRPLLEWVIRRLKYFGYREIIINVHHLAGQIIDFLKDLDHPGLRIEISEEQELLDTGSGLKRASFFFDDKQPFVLHNVDVLSDIDLTAMLQQHLAGNAHVTLAVKRRRTSRYMLFDSHNRLCGWRSLKEEHTRWVSSVVNDAQELAFCGIHIIDPDILPHLSEQKVYSIIPEYLRLAREGYRIGAFHADSYRWIDLGSKENLAEIDTVFSRPYFEHLLQV